MEKIKTKNKIQFYILCRNEERIQQWRARIPEIAGIDFCLWTGYSSMYRFITEAISHSTAPTLIVAHDDIIIGRCFARRALALIEELNDTFPNWGLAGNAGATIDNGPFYVFVKDPWCRPQRTYGPEPVACIDGNLMLINKENFLNANCEYPDLGGFHGYDLVLSLECIRSGLLVVADGRLGTVHLSGGNRGIYEQYIRSTAFQEYFRTRFADSNIPSMLGAHPVMPEDDPGLITPRPTLETLIDQALARTARSKQQSLAIVHMGGCSDASDGACRDLSEAFSSSESSCLIDVEFVFAKHLISEATSSDFGAAIRDFIRGLNHSFDHLWFLTAGASVEPNGLRAVMRALACRPEALIAGAYVSESITTRTTSAAGSSSELLQSVFDAGYFPLAALVFPAAALRRAADDPNLESAFGDGALMAAMVLSSPGVRTTLLREPIVLLPSFKSSARENHEAYGSDDDWEYVDRIAVLNSIVGQTSPIVWTLATETVLTPPPPSLVRWAQDIGHVISAIKTVLGNPGKYFGRAFSLGLRYLLHGDIRGLAREARLFRPR